MTITTYVKRNYDKLPKSTFNKEELVIVKRINHDDGGYGHHWYQGIGVDKHGLLYWCYSSGCSCDGSCGTAHKPTYKTLEVEGFNITDLDWRNIDFKSLEVGFEDYG